MNILLNEKPVKFLIAISKQNGHKSINELGKGIYNTYKSKYELYEKFNKMGILEVDESNKEVLLYLNEKGLKMMRAVLELV